MEILDAFSIATKIIDDSVSGQRFETWVPDRAGGIRRERPMAPVTSSLSRFGTRNTHQGCIEGHLLDTIASHSQIEVERGVLLTSLSVDASNAEDSNAYPVTVELQHLTEAEALPHQMRSHVRGNEVADGLFRSNLLPDQTAALLQQVSGRADTKEIVHAKYVVGCDGAHSSVRKHLGLHMVGQTMDHLWGVMDIIPLTNFPDMRKITTIQSHKGSMLIVPREKKLVRLYCQLSDVLPTEDGQHRYQVNPDAILAQVRKVIAPYTMDFSYCDWWTAYQVGQRLSDGYQDQHSRLFLAGDAGRLSAFCPRLMITEHSPSAYSQPSGGPGSQCQYAGYL